MKKWQGIEERDVPAIAPGVPKGLELGLRNYWYPVLDAAAVPVGKPVGFKMLGENLVAWRDRDGRPHILRDKCPHRAAKLSLGRVLGGDLQCAWHGLRFDGAGRCTLVPWEPEDSKLCTEIGVTAYPAQELVGYVWGYIGDTAKFPPPPLADCVPQEFSQPDEFAVFRHDSDVWNANWLQALDGSDAYHALILHSDSQSAADARSWKGGRPEKAAVPLEDRRMKIVDTPQGLRGVALDGDGNQIHHGHLLEGWKGERWTLPCLFTIPLRPAEETGAFATRVYQFPIDATHTRSVRIVTLRAGTDAERMRAAKLWDEVIGPRQRDIAAEDKVMAESLGDFAESRAEEFLLPPDRDMLKVRRMMADAFLAPLRGERPMPTKAALIYPL
jgi:phenylpropionate dioxygenase-like ring-hydroxylating dioxygenase large terminal subunit